MYAPPGPEPAPLVGELSGVATIDLVATQDLDLQPTSRDDGVGRDRERASGEVVAGSGRRIPRLGAHRCPAAEAQGRPGRRGSDHVCRADGSSRGHRRCALRLGDHAGWGDGGGGAGGLDDVVPRQRPPRATRRRTPSTSRSRRARSRWPTAYLTVGRNQRGVDDLVVERTRPASELPHDGVDRRLRAEQPVRTGRGADHRRGGSGPDFGEPSDHRASLACRMR